MAAATGREPDKTGETVTAAGEAAQPSAPPEGALHYESLFDSMPEPLAVWLIIRDQHGKPCDAQCRSTNEAFRRLFGVSGSYSQRLGELSPVHRGDPDILEICVRVATAGATETVEILHPALNKWYQVRVSRVLEGHLLTAVADVTERRHMETELQRLQYSLDQMDDYPTWNDSAGRIIEVSESTSRHLEYTREELLGMTVFDICPDLDLAAWKGNWTRAAPGTNFRVQVRHRTKSGRVFPVEINVNPMVFDGQAYHCTLCRDISERKQLEESLLVTRLSVDHAPDMIHWIDPEGLITYANRSMCDFLGYSLEELQAQHVWEISPGLTPELFKERWTAAQGVIYLSDEVWRCKDGREMSVEISSTKVLQQGRALGLCFVRDITQRKQAEQTLRESEEQLRQSLEAQTETLKALKEREEQLLHAQKMEAVGRLAGGIAHDFNNVLTTIIGYSDLLLSSSDCTPGSIAEDIGEIKAAAERGSALTKRILAFSRRQALQPSVAIAEYSRLGHRTSARAHPRCRHRTADFSEPRPGSGGSGRATVRPSAAEPLGERARRHAHGRHAYHRDGQRGTR